MLRRFVFLILVIGFSFQVGCDEPPQIRQYDVPKARSDLGDIGLKIEAPVQAPVFTRMVVAIAERDDATWFFKLTGPVDAVADSEKQWKKLFADLKFGDDGRPKWDAPEGWTLGPAKPMRYATLSAQIKDSGKVELSISSLGPNQNLLDNVNRWLGQLDKPNISEDELELGSMDSTAGELKIFDDIGMMNSTSMTPTKPSPKKEFTHKDMPAWEEGSVNSIVKARFTIGDEDAKAGITVTQLLAAANDWEPNAQRWAGQAGMDESKEFAAKNSTKIIVDKIEGDKIRLIPDNKESENAVIGIMIVRDNLAWFFKLFGDRDKVIEMESEFDAFVESFHFE